MSLLRRLIKRAREEGGEDWIQHCLDLPLSSSQDAPVGATPVMVPIRGFVAEDSGLPEEESAGEELLHLPEDMMEVRASLDMSTRNTDVTSGAEAGPAKRKRMPRKRFSPSPRRADVRIDRRFHRPDVGVAKRVAAPPGVQRIDTTPLGGGERLQEGNLSVGQGTTLPLCKTSQGIPPCGSECAFCTGTHPILKCFKIMSASNQQPGGIQKSYHTSEAPRNAAVAPQLSRQGEGTTPN